LPLNEIVDKCAEIIEQILSSGKFESQTDCIELVVREDYISIVHVRAMRINAFHYKIKEVEEKIIPFRPCYFNFDNIVEEWWLRNKIADKVIKKLKGKFIKYFACKCVVGLVPNKRKLTINLL